MGNKFIVYTDNNALSYLQTAKLAAIEQCWASQLVLFNFELRYRPGAANHNVDTLSRLPLLTRISQMSTNAGTVVPAEVTVSQQVSKPTRDVLRASALKAVPMQEKTDLSVLQAFDPVIGIFLRHWRRGTPPSKGEVVQGQVLRDLIRQWPRIREDKGVLYRKVQLPPIGEPVLQLLLLIAL